VGGHDVFAKGEHCIECIRELIKHMKNDTPSCPIVRKTLGRWKFLPEYIIPLLKFHAKDKKLSFLTLMLAV
jgi:timeless